MIIIIAALFIFILMFIKLFCLDSMTKKILICYCIWIFLVLMLSTFNLFGVNQVSNECYALWLLNVSLVVIFVIVFCKRSRVNKNDEDIHSWLTHCVDRLLASKALAFSLIIVAFVLLFFLFRYNSLIEDALISEFRTIRYSTLFNSSIEYYFFNYVIANFVELASMLLAILIVQKKAVRLVSILCFIDIALYTSIGFGRMTIFSFLVYLALAYILFRQNTKRSIRRAVALVISIIAVFFVAAIVVVIRLNGLEGLSFSSIVEVGFTKQLEQTAVYFTGGLRLFDLFLSNGFPAFANPTIFRASFGGVDEIVGSAATLAGADYHMINSDLGAMTQIDQSIGNGVEMNAFYTCLMNYYCDLGFFGCVVFPILHAALISFIIKNFEKRRNIFSLLLVFFVAKNAIFSIMRWNYQAGASVFLLIVLYVLSRMMKTRIKNQGSAEYQN